MISFLRHPDHLHSGEMTTALNAGSAVFDEH
jgi:hypothetical protein